MTGRRETAVKERHVQTRHKSCDGNSCHIDEAAAPEVGNGVSSASCLPVSVLGALTPIFIAFSVAAFVFSFPLICLCFTVTILPFTLLLFIQWDAIHLPHPVKVHIFSHPRQTRQFTTKLFFVEETKPDPYPKTLCFIGNHVQILHFMCCAAISSAFTALLSTPVSCYLLKVNWGRADQRLTKALF